MKVTKFTAKRNPETGDFFLVADGFETQENDEILNKKCRYVVKYGSVYGKEIAKFSNEDHAQAFGRLMSITDGYSDVWRQGDGLIGQYEKGKATPEFIASL